VAMLTVNLDLVAALRELSGGREPDPAQVAVLAEMAGADGVAIQLRRDRRHVRDRDLYILKEIVKTRLTIEIPPAEEVIKRVLEVKPAMVTFVADHADTDTPVSGIDFSNPAVDFSSICTRFHGVGVSTCFLVEPESNAIKGTARIGSGAVMINCTGFTKAHTLEEAQTELDRIDQAAQAGTKAGLTIYAGRGINFKNVIALHELGLIDEFFVGHSISSSAMLHGYQKAVKIMSDLIRKDKERG